MLYFQYQTLGKILRWVFPLTFPSLIFCWIIAMSCYITFFNISKLFYSYRHQEREQYFGSNSAYLETLSHSRVQLFVTGQDMQCRKTSDFTIQRNNISLYILDRVYPSFHSRVIYTFFFHCYAENSLTNRIHKRLLYSYMLLINCDDERYWKKEYALQT